MDDINKIGMGMLKNRERIEALEERLGSLGSESGGLLCRREAEDNEEPDGERSRVCCAHCADECGLKAMHDKLSCMLRSAEDSAAECEEQRVESEMLPGMILALEMAIKALEVIQARPRRSSEARVARTKVPHRLGNL